MITKGRVVGDKAESHYGPGASENQRSRNTTRAKTLQHPPRLPAGNIYKFALGCLREIEENAPDVFHRRGKSRRSGSRSPITLCAGCILLGPIPDWHIQSRPRDISIRRRERWIPFDPRCAFPAPDWLDPLDDS